MFKRSIYQKIYKKIKKYQTIVIARHVGPDPDALGSSLGLKQAILNTFPNKNVYTVGCPASKFRYLGTLDNFSEEMYQNSLLIVLDTPDAKTPERDRGAQAPGIPHKSFPGSVQGHNIPPDHVRRVRAGDGPHVLGRRDTHGGRAVQEISGAEQAVLRAGYGFR